MRLFISRTRYIKFADTGHLHASSLQFAIRCDLLQDQQNTPALFRSKTFG
jgi:hypothetical protein